MASEKLKGKRQRRQHRKKLHHLRQQLVETRSAGDRQRITKKIRRISLSALASEG